MPGPQSQPLNADISVFRRVRAQTDQDRHDPIKGMGRFRAKQVIAPSQEIRVLQTSDAVISDAWRYGHPVVRYVRGGAAPTPAGERTKTLQQVYDNTSDLAMPLRLTVERRDVYIEKSADGVCDDLHEDVRDSN
jgi:hypothetical protein